MILKCSTNNNKCGVEANYVILNIINTLKP